VHPEASAVLERAGGFATTAQLLTVMTRQQLDVQVKSGCLIRVWYGIYAAQQPNLLGCLAALDIFMGRHAVACMGTTGARPGPRGTDASDDRSDDPSTHRRTAETDSRASGHHTSVDRS